MKVLKPIVKHIKKEMGINVKKESRKPIRDRAKQYMDAYTAYYTICYMKGIPLIYAAEYLGRGEDHGYRTLRRKILPEYGEHICQSYIDKQNKKRLKWLKEENKILKEKLVCLELFLSEKFPLLEVPESLTELSQRRARAGGTKTQLTT